MQIVVGSYVRSANGRQGMEGSSPRGPAEGTVQSIAAAAANRQQRRTATSSPSPMYMRSSARMRCRRRCVASRRAGYDTHLQRRTGRGGQGQGGAGGARPELPLPAPGCWKSIRQRSAGSRQQQAQRGCRRTPTQAAWPGSLLRRALRRPPFSLQTKARSHTSIAPIPSIAPITSITPCPTRECRPASPPGVGHLAHAGLNLCVIGLFNVGPQHLGLGHLCKQECRCV